MSVNNQSEDEIYTRAAQLRELTSLSEQEARIQAYREAGLTPSDIADQLDISRSQVSVALDRISQKTQQAQEMTSIIRGDTRDTPTRTSTILPADARPRDEAQIFLAPCVNEHAQRHFQHTVLKGVDVDVDPYRSHVPSRYSGQVAIWGTGEGNRSSAGAMEPGDVILFYVGENTYSHYAIVREIERNPELAEHLWTPYGDTIRKDERENWPWVMYLSEPVQIDIDSERLHDTFGWSQSYPLGFTRVADHRVDNLVRAHGSVQQYLEEKVVRHAAGGGGEVPLIDMSTETASAPTDSDERDAKTEPSLADLRERAEQAAQESATATTTTTTRYSRSAAVRDYALARAEGTCEGCGEPAPFEKPNGEPYLEVHHLFQVSDEGLDDPDAVVALCPTCHRRIHHGATGNEYNKQLIEWYRDRRSDTGE